MLSHNSFWHKISHSIRAFFRRKRVETELDSELRFHLEARIEASIRTGMSPETARQSALHEVFQAKARLNDRAVVRRTRVTFTTEV